MCGLRSNTEQKKREKLDDLKCSPGSDIESQVLLNNVFDQVMVNLGLCFVHVCLYVLCGHLLGKG